MRCQFRSRLSLSLIAACAAVPAVAGGIPSPFDDPETTRPAAAKSRPADPAPGDDIIAPGELPAGAAAATGTIERETLAPIEAEPAPAAAAANPGPAALPPGDGSDEPPRFGSSSSSEPGGSDGQPPRSAPAATTRTVMRNDPAPAMTANGLGPPIDLWQGLTPEAFEAAVSKLDIPPRSPTLHALFRRLLTSADQPSPSGAADLRLTAVRVDALERSGLIDEAQRLLDQHPSAGSDPVLAVLAARTSIARGDRDAGCAVVAAMNAAQGPLPASLKGSSLLVRAYCAAIADKRESAQLQVALARDEGVEDSAGLDAIDAIATGAKPVVRKGQKVGPIDWRILELGGPVDAGMLVETAGPSLSALLLRDVKTEPATRLAAAERAAQLNAIPAADLAQAYRGFTGGDAGDEGPAAAAVRRAALFQSAEDEITPLKKARLIRSFLDEARRAGLYWPGLQIMAPAAASLQRVPEIGWFAETAIETAIASGNFAGARQWAEFGGTLDAPANPFGEIPGGRSNGHDHWLALADVADPSLNEGRSRHLAELEGLAARGRFAPDQLHRLATVLDALQIQVPIPLWDLASRTEQPNSGFLPDTGVLTALSQAAKKKEFGHTVLRAMQALGPNGAEGAHIISLGDTIRALRSAGLEADARALALEALFMGWPRSSG